MRRYFGTWLLLGTRLNAGTDSPAQALESFDGVYDDAWTDEVDEVKRRVTGACGSPRDRACWKARCGDKTAE